MKLFRLFYLGFFFVQFYLTLFGGFFWPFSSHRLFSQYPESTKKIIQIGVIDQFNSTQYVHPGQVLHLEYARCSGLIRNVYLYSNSSFQQKALYDFMLQRINLRPWVNFDELLPMIRRQNYNFVGLSIEEHLVELTSPIKILEKRVLYPNSSFVHEERPRKQPINPFLLIVYLIIYFPLALKFYYSKKTKDWILDQSKVSERIILLKMTLAIIIIFLLIFGPFDFYAETADFLYQSSWLPKLTGLQFCILVWFVNINVILWAIDIYPWLTGPAFVFVFAHLQYYTTCFSTSYWITNTHLIIFSTLLCLRIDRTYILFFCQSYVSAMYFQAGLSKLFLGGFRWFLTGQRIWTEALLLGTPFGKYLASYGSSVFMPMGWATGIFELFLSPLLLFAEHRGWVAVVATIFHIGTYFVLGISFWFVALLYPALFF